MRLRQPKWLVLGSKRQLYVTYNDSKFRLITVLSWKIWRINNIHIIFFFVNEIVERVTYGTRANVATELYEQGFPDSLLVIIILEINPEKYTDRFFWYSYIRFT